MKTYKYENDKSITVTETLEDGRRMISNFEEKTSARCKELELSGVKIELFDYAKANAESIKSDSIRYLNSTDWYFARLAGNWKVGT